MFESMQKSDVLGSQVSITDKKLEKSNEFFNQVPNSGVQKRESQEEIGLSMFGSVKSDKSENQSVNFQPKSK
jgi:hypothetical protein